MSVTPDEKEFVELPYIGDAAFGALLDALVPAEAGAAGGPDAGAGGQAPAVPVGDPAAATPGGTAAPAVGDGAPAGGQPGAAGQAPAGSPDAGAGTPPAADGAAAGDAQQPAADGAGSDLPATWTADPAVAVVELGTLSKTLEENVTKAYQQEAYDEVREEHTLYFEALEKHPRLLVGTQVPAIGKEGMETLRTTEDAREWQEAVKSVLVAEIREQATQKMEDSSDFLQTLHSSIELFQNNKDLIPGTKGFDRRLADAFAEMASPYEIRDEDDKKLLGYSIPVQPIIDNLRKQLKAAAPASAPAAAPPAAARQTVSKPDPPQAGIPSKAGSSSEKEDFSTLFGTIGLPNLQI